MIFTMFDTEACIPTRFILSARTEFNQGRYKPYRIIITLINGTEQTMYYDGAPDRYNDFEKLKTQMESACSQEEE